MKTKLLLLVFLWTNILLAQVKILTWNVENLGSKKSDSEVQYIASILKEYDIVALQEIVAGYGGVQTVAKLADELNRMGNKWEYCVSESTESSSYKTERYAFLYKSSVVKLIGKPWLEKKYSLKIDREPYFATFSYKEKQFTLVNFHAITQSKQPETEIKYFKHFPVQYPNLNLIFLGDFNCPQSHTVFNPLKAMGYKPVFQDQKTSLKKECKGGDCLSKEFDNIWYNSRIVEVKKAKAIHFYKDFTSLELARKISDHIPITVQFEFK